MNNKRRNDRVSCLVPVVGKKNGVFGQTRTVDISKRGLGFISKSRVPINKKIAIELDFSTDADPVLVMGQVKWVRPLSKTDNYRIGVYFEDFLKESKRILDQYFRK